MFATESFVEVTCIKSIAGRCFKCHKFRYCEHQTQSLQIICKDCVQTLKNQHLLNEIIPQAIEPNPKPPREKKLREKKEKLADPKPPREKKLREKKEKLADPKIRESRDERSKRKILNFIKASEKALTAKEIIESGQCGHKNTVYQKLKILVEIGDVVTSSDKAKNRVFTNKDRFHLLQVERIIRVNTYAQMTRMRVLNYIKREDRILETMDVVNATNITRKTVIRAIIFFKGMGDIALIKVHEKANKMHFVASEKTELVEKLMELDQRSTANQARKILESSDRGVSIGDVLVLMGKNRRNGGSYKYLKKLFEQWGCRTYRQGCGLYYYLVK